MKRHVPLITEHFYHIYNKSIYKFVIFNSPDEYERMLQLLTFYRFSQMPISFSTFNRRILPKHANFHTALSTLNPETKPQLVRILAYCLMPTHIHLLLQQLQPNGIMSFMQNIQGAYTQFFNLKHNRRGPLWQSRFGNTMPEDERGLIQETLYIHANPMKDLPLSESMEWKYSSYNEYIGNIDQYKLCEWQPYINTDKKSYKSLFASYLNLHTSRK